MIFLQPNPKYNWMYQSEPEAALKEYLKIHLKLPFVTAIAPISAVLDFVATAAPGVKEILTIGKIAWEVREAIAGRAEHDMVVVDAAATDDDE